MKAEKFLERITLNPDVMTGISIIRERMIEKCVNHQLHNNQ